MATPQPVSYSVPSSPIISGRTCPRISVGTYTGSGAAQSVSLGWRPDLVIIKGGIHAAVYHTSLGWHDRSNYLINDDSLYMVSFTDTGFALTSAADVSEAGAPFHYIAISDNGAGLLSETAWIGNLTDNRRINVGNDLIDLVFVKRDSPRPAAIKHRNLAANVSLLGNGGSGTYIRSIQGGDIIIDGSLPVNENDGPATVGEGMEGVAFCRSQFSRLVSWTGDGTAGRVIATGITPAWCLLIRNDGSAPLPEIVSSTAPAGSSLPIAAAAPNTGRVASLSSSGLTLGDATWNASGVSYTALVLVAESPSVAQASPVVSGKYVELSGSSSAIQFGKNAALDVGDGPFTIEWYGRRMSSGACIPLWMRGNGTINGTKAANAGEYSWGLFIYPPVDPYNHGWQGDVFRVVHTNYLAGPLVSGEINTNWYSWNTGIVAPINKDMHLMLTHDGKGLWHLYQDGKCIKQREMDMTSSTWGSRTNAGTGNHDALIGARMAASGSTLYDSAQMRVYLARIYGRQLSSSDVRKRYEKAVLGSPVGDVSPLEEWAFTEGAGTTLAATNNSANNATIVNGTWGNR